MGTSVNPCSKGDAPRLVAVKSGKRNRYAAHQVGRCRLILSNPS